MKEILLVEDSQPDAELVRRALKGVGVTNPIRWLGDGAEALRWLQDAELSVIDSSVPAVLVLDLKLPGVSGFTILEQIQERPAFRQMLRVVLSNLDDLESIRQAYRRGAHSFLTKPVQTAHLRELVATFPGYWSFKGNAGQPVETTA